MFNNVLQYVFYCNMYLGIYNNTFFVMVEKQKITQLMIYKPKHKSVHMKWPFFLLFIFFMITIPFQ